MSTKKKPEKDFSLPEWLADEEYGSHDVEVFTHPRTKEYLALRDAHDRARAEFDELEQRLLAPQGDEGDALDRSMADVNPDEQRLLQLADEVREAVEKVNELAPIVRETMHVIKVVDRLTLEEIADLGKSLEESATFRELLREVGTLDGEKLPFEGWLALERKCGITQWARVQADVVEYLGQPGVTPDFSPLTSPSIRE